ncbi:DUF2147 domain-containing protein [Acinetobacter tianfuensis]|uniref:DUF2147 domain-containing protein n=1 Tax=Acinetobacter tianfuensis TaxID=2419603 RepID=A0A3A8E7D1_9GAMM|nr:DUF2147 domain-containing protein [Acinetobacter tianfuensis]RKG30525.1 DUF2147 domain-containing protein [Acinetobacter tianfuensis]
MRKLQFLSAILFSSLSGFALAKDLNGTWQNIDDKTGSPKALLEIRKMPNGSYNAKVTKITPRAGYTPRETCANCPAPYTNKPILGLDVLTGLKETKEGNYDHGKILDPLTGKIYSTKAKLSPNGNRLTLRGYVGVSALGRSQTWIRQD